MERLLEAARRVGAEAEVYCLSYQFTDIFFEDSRLKGIETMLQSGLSLRLIKDGRLGFAYTRNLRDPEALLQDALVSLAGGAEAPASFCAERGPCEAGAYDASVESLPAQTVVEECRGICARLSGAPGGQINVNARYGVRDIRIVNSRGLARAQKTSSFTISPQLCFPGSYACISQAFHAPGFAHYPVETAALLKTLFAAGRREGRPRSGKMKALFLPEAMKALYWRLEHALSARSVLRKESRLAGRLGERILSEKLTFRDEPRAEAGGRAFDDEGTARRPLALVERGVLKSYFSDIHSAAKLGVPATGHGYRLSPNGGDALCAPPAPALMHHGLLPGDASLDRMLAQMDRGVVIAGAIGAHSGNIPNGDYSVGLAPGLLVENGEIVGLLKNAMASGNIFENLREVVAVEDTAHPLPEGPEKSTAPSLLIDGVSVTVR